MSDLKKNPMGIDSGVLSRIWSKCQDIAEPLLKYADPVKKVCYDHLANHYDRKYRSKFPKHHSKVFWFDMGLLAMLGALLVTWFFADTLPSLIPVTPLARIDAVSPQEIVSGADTEYVYAYRNDSPKSMGCAVLRVYLPPGTVLTSDATDVDLDPKVCLTDTTTMGHALSENTQHDILIFSLGTLRPNSKNEIRFKARSYGATGDTSVMSAEMIHWDDAATVSSRVSTLDERPITGSVLSLDLHMPPNVDRGVIHEIGVTYANNAARPLNGVAIRVAAPEDFTVTGSVPAISATDEWSLGTLPAGEHGTLKLYGYFRAVPEMQRVASTFIARAYVRENGQTRNDLLERVRKNADPRAASLSFDSQIEEPAGRDSILPGDKVRVRISYKNDGAQSIRHLHVTVDPGATFITDKVPASLSWDETSAPALAEVKPGESGELTVTFAVKNSITPADLGTTLIPSLHVSSRAEYALVDDAAMLSDRLSGIVRVDAGIIDVPISTELGLDAAAIYYTKVGDQLGVGPLPPKVGETTKYRVFLTVSTTTSGVRNTIVEATLPPNVTWTGKSSVTAGTAMDYLPTSRVIRWNLGDIPAFANGDAASIGGSFEVALLPTAADVETSPALIKNIKVTGRDKATNYALHAITADVSTELPYDQRAAGKGAVLPATPTGTSTKKAKR